jgi:hypothetical protein
MIAVQGVEISREAGEGGHVGFRDSPGWALPFVADGQVVESKDIPVLPGHVGLGPSERS